MGYYIRAFCTSDIVPTIKEILDWAATQVLNHLQQTKFIVVNQIPTSDFDDDGYDANGIFLTYFVRYCGGMIQGDGEGFYEGHKLIVKLD